MAASLSELLARFDTSSRGVAGIPAVAGYRAPRLPDTSHLLRARASTLVGVQCGGAKIPGITGLALQLVGQDLATTTSVSLSIGFLRC